MLKRSITYEDFNDDTLTETFYFNLTKSELVEIEFGYQKGMEETIKDIVKAENRGQLIAEFKRLILMSYGQKTPDGKRFIKSEALREEFSQTAAYNALFMELATNDKAASDFINGIAPKDLRDEMLNIQKTMTNEEPKPTEPPKTTAEIAAAQNDAAL